MNNSYTLVFTILAILLAIVDFNYCWKAYKMPGGDLVRYLGLSALFAGVTTASYLLSLLARTSVVMSVCSSIYFVGIDFMLVCLLRFTYRITRTKLERNVNTVKNVICGYALVECIIFLINIFNGIAIEYKKTSEGFLSIYSYQMKPLYHMHLAYTYILTVIILIILIHKAAFTPRQYRNQYLLIVLAIVVVVLTNAVFLFIDNKSPLSTLDWSIFGYSVGLYIMFWATFNYRENDMLKSLAMTIFQNIDQGIVLFDYMDELIMYNQRAAELLPDIHFQEQLTMPSFIETYALEPEDPAEEHYSVQCERHGSHGQPLRCDFSRLRDNQGGIVGNLFVFTDATDKTDIMTGYQLWDTFKRFSAENPYAFDHPTAVAMFDIVGLAEINRSFGREIGDQRIRVLSKIIRKHMPKETYYVREHEAHLIAICPHYREKDIFKNVQEVLEAAGGSVLYGLSETSDDFAEIRNVIDAIGIAASSLQTKKLLNPQSHHSQTLTSLVRALRESDSDTEAHVVRTQKMGEALGKRIGLSDKQLADLRLLCLLHDIGKIGIPLEILNKPGRLTDQEWAVLRTHAVKGYQIALSSEELKGIAPLILYHHEQWDGKGYPEKLGGESIPILSRIISIVDSYDAMVNTRVYRKGRSPEEAQDEIRRCSGTQFDPFLAEEFLKMLEENPEIAGGEKTGGEEVRVFIQGAVNTDDVSGDTQNIHYSRYMLDLDDIIVEVDEEFEEITGYSSHEAVNEMSQYDLIPDEDRAYYIMQVNNSFNRGNTAYLKHKIVRKDGEVIWVVCYGKRYYDSAEKAFRSEIFIFRADQ